MEGFDGTTTFTYNSVYKLVSVEYSDQSVTTFECDSNGNRISMIDSEGSSTYVYDNRNRLLSETRTIMGDLYTITYQYDAVSNVTSTTYPDQSVITYEYDSLGRIVSIPGYAQFTYNADSLLASLVYSNGAVTTYEYDSRDRPLTLYAQKNDTDLLLMSYQYDGVGNIQQMEYSRRLPDQQWVQSVETFGYDWLNRLVSAQGDYGLLTYSYDAVGNRLSENDLTYTYNNMNELLSINNGMTLTYDEMGNTRTKYDGTDTWTFTHDKRNMHVGGYEGSYTFIIAKQGRLDIYVDEEGLDLHVKIYSGATVTLYVPMGQAPPNIYGADSYIIVYYYPSDDESESPSNEEE